MTQHAPSHLTVIRALRRARVPLSGVLFFVFIFFAEPTWASILVGSLMALVGIVWRAWASGCIRKDAVLTTSGPYAYTRNPLYLGSLVMGLGFSVACRSLLLLLCFFVFFGAVYVPTMIAEEGHLRRLFGGAYERYEQAVPFFFPKVWGREKHQPLNHRPSGPEPDTAFLVARYMENREYQVVIGFLAAVAILIVKAM